MYSKLSILILALVAISACQDPNWADQANWGGSCQTGTKQSPIDLTPASSKFCSPNDVGYLKLSCTQYDTSTGTGGVYEVQVPDSGSAVLQANFDGVLRRGVAAAQKLQFHSPSEHTLKGKVFELEMQIVFDKLETANWKAEIQNLDATGVDFDQLATQFLAGTFTEATGVIVAFLFEVDTSISDTDVLGLTAGKTDLQKVLGCTTTRFFYRYEGSMTVPPCTEGKEWLVYREPIKISQTQLTAIKAKLTANNKRDIKLQGSRTVRLTGSSCALISEL